MAPKYGLVLWTKMKKTSVVPEESFVKSYGTNGKEIPISEGTIRMVAVGDKRYEAEILRICASKKYLESLLVTKEGKVLLHGSKPPCHTDLAKRSNLLNDEPQEQKTERNVLRNLNLNAEEQQPITRLDVSSQCSHGCPSCCSGTLPPFPTIPEGFVSTVVSLAEYFQQFHRSTIANIIAAGHILPVAEPPHWMMAAAEKVELKKGYGVWINAKALERIILQVESSKKSPHQTLVKHLLTYLLGVERYIETPAEKIDRRLMSAVVGLVNSRHPDVAQPPERYFKGINLNRSYLLKRKNEGAFDDPIVFKQYPVGVASVDSVCKVPTYSSEEERNKIFSEHEAKRPRKSVSSVDSIPSNNANTINNLSECGRIMTPFDSEISEDVVSNSSNNVNKIVVVRRPATNVSLSAPDVIQRSPVVAQSNTQPNISANRVAVVSSNQPTVCPANLLTLSSTDRPIGNFSRGLTSVVSTSPVTTQPVRSTLPFANRSHLMVKSANSANPAAQPNVTSANLMGKTTAANAAYAANPVAKAYAASTKIPFMVPTDRVLVSTSSSFAPANRLTVSPSIRQMSTYPRIAVTSTTSSSSLPLGFTPKTNKITPTLKSGPSSSVPGIPAASMSQPYRPISQPIQRANSQVPKAPSPDIIEIPFGDGNVQITPYQNIKLEGDFEIEGALDIPL